MDKLLSYSFFYSFGLIGIYGISWHLRFVRKYWFHKKQENNYNFWDW